MLNYANSKEADADRNALRGLLLVLDVSNRTLRRDECGAWGIRGRRGHVYTWGPSGGWLLFCEGHNPRKWAAIKRRLSFCRVTQDGDTEGCLRLFDLPTPEQAAAIRKTLGLRRRRKLDPTRSPGMILTPNKRGVSGAPVSEGGKDGLAHNPEAPAPNFCQNPPVNEPKAAQSRFRRRGR
jgi:hypothetical protein